MCIHHSSRNLLKTCPSTEDFPIYKKISNYNFLHCFGLENFIVVIVQTWKKENEFHSYDVSSRASNRPPTTSVLSPIL